MKLKNIFNHKGFTLIELLLFMGIFSILMTVMFQLLTAVFDVQLESQSTSSVTADANYILNKLTYDIKKASSIASPSVGSQSSTLSFSDGSYNYSYSSSGGNLIFTNSSLSLNDQVNSIDTGLSSLNFKRLSDSGGLYSTITITFTLKSKTIRRGGINSQTYTTTIGTR